MNRYRHALFMAAIAATFQAEAEKVAQQPRITVYPPKGNQLVTDADRNRLAKAQAKRDRKAKRTQT